MFPQALDFLPVVFGGPSFLRLWLPTGAHGSNSTHSCFVQSSQCFKTSWANIFNEKLHLKLPSSSFSCKIRLSELGQCPCSSGHHNHPRSYKKCPHSHSVLPPVFSFPTSPWCMEIISSTVGTHPCPPTVSQAELGHVISLTLLIKPGGRSCHYFSLTDDNTEAGGGGDLLQATQLLGSYICFPWFQSLCFICHTNDCCLLHMTTAHRLTPPDSWTVLTWKGEWQKSLQLPLGLGLNLVVSLVGVYLPYLTPRVGHFINILSSL